MKGAVFWGIVLTLLYQIKVTQRLLAYRDSLVPYWFVHLLSIWLLPLLGAAAVSASLSRFREKSGTGDADPLDDGNGELLDVAFDVADSIDIDDA
ncbi:hypothetical protein [Chitinimonas sp.]|uniref:hypothetical protein n=1 Tax=Chitinimonas sp. TaxID=1934313 RepID=UPI0035AF6BD0